MLFSTYIYMNICDFFSAKNSHNQQYFLKNSIFYHEYNLTFRRNTLAEKLGSQKKFTLFPGLPHHQMLFTPHGRQVTLKGASYVA